MPAWMVQHVAAMAGVDGVDVDASSPLRTWLAAHHGAAESLLLPVRSIWIPIEGLHSIRNRLFIDSLVDRQHGSSPLIVLLLSNGWSVRDLARAFDVVRPVSARWQMSIGIPASGLKGGRPHLVQLGSIRRFAEEWSLGVALDLSGRFDPTWEAEAAIARLGERLNLLRMPSSAPSRAAIGRDRVACRALHAAIDREQSLDIAVSSVKLVPILMTPRGAARDAERAADYVAERAAVHAQALREGIGRYQDSPSSRGN